jgi:negative regulator of flagellin synthesis FlgM
MTDAINGADRANRLDLLTEQRLRQLKESDRAKENEGPRTSSVSRPASDELALSNTSQKAASGPDFDQQKVDRIKKAIEEGNYPLDSRRIAESFVALEKLI